MNLKDYKLDLEKFLLEEYDTAIKNYEKQHLAGIWDEDYYRGQIVEIEDILNYCFGLHKEYFN